MNSVNSVLFNASWEKTSQGLYEIIVNLTSQSIIDASSNVKVTISGVENQPYSGKSGDFLLTSYDASNLALDITSGISGIYIKPSEITDIEFSLDNLHANATSNLTLSFKIANALKNGDKLHINFPVQNLKWSTGYISIIHILPQVDTAVTQAMDRSWSIKWFQGGRHLV